MRVGSRGDYGLRALVYLASQEEPDKPVQVHAIAEHQQIPEDYLRQLLVTLRLGGFVRSVRGPHGGYLLAKSAKDIRMGEVLDALEGGIEPMPCSHYTSGSERCGILAGCNIRAAWRRSVEAMQKVLEQTTLAELAQQGEVR